MRTSTASLGSIIPPLREDRASRAFVRVTGALPARWEVKLELSDVITGIHDLPSLPVVVLQLMQNLNDKDAHYIAHKIEQDQALTTKILRLANSAFYGMQRQVMSIRQAISILGLDSVRVLVMAAVVTEKFTGSAGSSLDFTVFWRHSIGTALCARALGARLSVNPDQAFIGGLLHDIGRLVLAAHAAPAYEEVIIYRKENDCYLFEAERAVLGLDHMLVGRAMMEHWNFPSLILDAVEHHHSPEKCSASGLVAIVNLADCIAHGLDFCGNEEDLVPPVAPAAWNKIQLNEDLLIHLFSEVDQQFEEVCAILFS
ncbi:HDOD domain-containing protein [Herbaspirillum sp. RTI4]|uniref:HDOD domain-containing protein n=1 Tax=Herbaspirillum sp. RTI4 TaxID=3048640 RepID=UPI002AB4543B|nr:HDOD domain-containing protein [Herbaspirillum sp. RTI4]MDY7578232.1 HDOD domain-containing protein [Herbaspirillum sp. RTI4]MEA9981570.1 HDOD domain-containing protein [Herbaspirillum sp. RTI4]